jgi:hypothetical protein
LVSCLFGVLGRFYAVPALAQAVRAALVRDVDNPALNFIQINRSISLPVSEVSVIAQQGLQYTVPAGHRLVLDTLAVAGSSLHGRAPFTVIISGHLVRFP